MSPSRSLCLFQWLGLSLIVLRWIEAITWRHLRAFFHVSCFRCESFRRFFFFFFSFIFNFLLSVLHSHHITWFWPKSPPLHHLISIAALLAHMADESLKRCVATPIALTPTCQTFLSVSRGFSFPSMFGCSCVEVSPTPEHPKPHSTGLNDKRWCRSLTWELLYKTFITKQSNFPCWTRQFLPAFSRDSALVFSSSKCWICASVCN